VIKLSQAISDGFQVKKPPNRTVLALLDFSKAYNKVWRTDLLATMLRKGVPVRYVRWIQGFLSNRQARVRLNWAYSRTWTMWEGVPQGSVLGPLLFLFVIDDLQDYLPMGVHFSLFADDSALWVHSPRKEEAVLILQKGMREVYRWAREKKLTLNLKKCEVSFFSAEPHEAKWQSVVEVKRTHLAFNPNPLS
jgi:ribonuclease P/MRP protein subunit RPP40